MKDSLGRTINYLRVSVTDRCNLRCRYCMPEEGVEWLPHEDILSYEDILRLAAIFARLGVEKGAVTPLGVVNDDGHTVRVILDRDLQEEELLGVHPNVNTATVWLRPAELEAYIRDCGNPMEWMTL